MVQVRYSGILLADESRERLCIALAHLIEPLLDAGWKMQNCPPPGQQPDWLPHHMTICLGPLGDLDGLRGTTQTLWATHYGQNDKAAAVKVRCEVPCSNATPHITCAVSPSGKPFHSNTITEWVPLEQEIELTGWVKEVC